MKKIQYAYHCSHEQFAPSQLLKLAVEAEDAGFDAIHSSDHFHPWSERQGHSGFTFSWIAAALQATQSPFSMVCAPGQRYHPAIVAQAIATLCEMFPGRINFELGSGEFLNESITGEPWPSKEKRNQRLLECAEIIKDLLRGNAVNHDGLVTVKNAKLYSLPKILPRLLCAAISGETAAWAGRWADGLLTTADSTAEKTMEKIRAFREAGGKQKPVYIQYAFSYSASMEKAISGAYEQWRSSLVPADKKATLSAVSQFDKEGEKYSVEDLLRKLDIFDSISALEERVREYELPGVERIILHNVNIFHGEFLADWKKHQKKS